MNLLDKLNEKKLTLIVSLPANDVELAKAAIEAGADMVKIHLNVEHRASKTRFGSLQEELENVKVIRDLCNTHNISLGIVAGGHNEIPMSEIDGIMENGFEFISLYDKHMNPLIMKKDIYKMVAIDDNYDIELVKVYDSLSIDILECSIMDPQTYGEPLTVREILQYKSIRNSTNTPIVIPTQRKITPEQSLILQEIGINGIMIGAIVTGKTKESIYKSTLEFRETIDNFNKE
ncbi:hypothetical protein E5347_00835 [Clostridium sartagoforme]|uniref:Uncharacterized protein n=1 Tax=Clostridium sartagoforme TaxID=84031 RepID=A0A4S2DMT5_9CLOT|nr:hypothetical protein [Clostridium sartagoforme]TGY43385.1 hypothetical protein E5347_00835 [Clostridium sartagoforme]